MHGYVQWQWSLIADSIASSMGIVRVLTNDVMSRQEPFPDDV